MVVAVQSMTARALSSLRLPTNKTPSGLSTMERAFGMLPSNFQPMAIKWYLMYKIQSVILIWISPFAVLKVILSPPSFISPLAVILRLFSALMVK